MDKLDVLVEKYISEEEKPKVASWIKGGQLIYFVSPTRTVITKCKDLDCVKAVIQKSGFKQSLAIRGKNLVKIDFIDEV